MTSARKVGVVDKDTGCKNGAKKVDINCEWSDKDTVGKNKENSKLAQRNLDNLLLEL